MARKTLGGFSCGPFLSLELWSRLENYGRSRQRRPPYFLNSRLKRRRASSRDKTTAINKLWQRNDSHQNDSRHRDPKQPSKRFHPAYAPAARARVCRGGSRNSQQSQAERQPRGPGHALESSFWSVALGTAQGGRSRNAKRPGALTGIDLAESADCPCDVIR